MIATLIEHLSHEDDPQQLMEDRLAQGVAAGTYLGLWWRKRTLNGPPTYVLIMLLLGGADTVSERNDIVNGINNGIKLGKCAEDPFIPLSTSELVPAQSDP